MRQRSATARACANVALVKYWGKRDARLNLPATGSISWTVGGLTATATVSLDDSQTGPRFVQDGAVVAGVAGERMATFLDLAAATASSSARLRADVCADFPVAAGLASSAAIYCAVAAAATSFCGARMTLAALSALARRGSGSAARSVFGGFVEWHRGARDDGCDSIAEPLLPESGWDLAMAIAIVDEAKKPLASRDAMQHVADTSPLYGGWLAAQDADLRDARHAIAARDLDRLGTISEENCLRMHATAFAARPPILYWAPATIAVISEVRALRGRGIAAYFTIDAGPQVKVLCEVGALAAVADAVSQVPGVRRVLRSTPGSGVEIVEGEVPWR
jgi:diphosphomevalonate decarboxylase